MNWHYAEAFFMLLCNARKRTRFSGLTYFQPTTTSNLGAKIQQHGLEAALRKPFTLPQPNAPRPIALRPSKNVTASGQTALGWLAQRCSTPPKTRCFQRANGTDSGKSEIFSLSVTLVSRFGMKRARATKCHEAIGADMLNVLVSWVQAFRLAVASIGCFCANRCRIRWRKGLIPPPLRYS